MEVRDLLKKGGLLDKFDEVQHWYNGYHFGTTRSITPGLLQII